MRDGCFLLLLSAQPRPCQAAGSDGGGTGQQCSKEPSRLGNSPAQPCGGQGCGVPAVPPFSPFTSHFPAGNGSQDVPLEHRLPHAAGGVQQPLCRVSPQPALPPGRLAGEPALVSARLPHGALPSLTAHTCRGYGRGASSCPQGGLSPQPRGSQPGQCLNMWVLVPGSVHSPR